MNCRPWSLALAFLSLAPVLAAADQAELAGRLRADESLVSAARGEISVRWSPTPPESIAAIEEENRRIGQPQGSFRVSPDEARAWGYSARWLRRGPMERLDQYAMDDPARVASQRAFDGHIFCSLSFDGATARGEIQSREGSHWDSVNREYPYSFLFEFQTAPYSDIARRSPRYREDTVDVNGIECRRFHFAHPDIPQVEFSLVFDAQYRLLTRTLWMKEVWRKDETFKLRELHEFSEYELIELPAGATLWFPMKATYRSYSGTTDTGEPAEFTRRDILVQDLRFNVDIPAEAFALTFPAGAEIFDGLTGLGSIRSRDSLNRSIAAALEAAAADVISDPRVRRPSPDPSIAVGIGVAKPESV